MKPEDKEKLISPELEKALEKREVLRLEGRIESDEDSNEKIGIRLYDTDEILVMGYVKRPKNPKLKGNKANAEKIRVPAKAIYNLRTGGRAWNEPEEHMEYPQPCKSEPDSTRFLNNALRMLTEKGININKWAKAHEKENTIEEYPELSDFIKKINKNLSCRKLKFDKTAISWIPYTLIGRGYIHPLAFLHPKIFYYTIKKVHFPFKNEKIFDFEKRKRLEKDPRYISNEEAFSYDGNITLIRPWEWSYKKGRYSTVIECFFLNPSKYNKYLEGHPEVENLLPSRDDWVFEVTHGLENGSTWLKLQGNRFDDFKEYNQDFFKQERNYICLKTDDELISKIEKIASLPLIGVNKNISLYYSYL